MGPDRPLSIFVPHGATQLTDDKLHGDGLVQWGFVKELARRGHSLVVVSPNVSLSGTIPPNVEIHEIEGGDRLPLPVYMARAHAIYRRAKRSREFDIIHQMNPVVRGVSLAWAFEKTPIVLGTYVGDWPHEVPAVRIKRGPPLHRAAMAVKILLDVLQDASASRLLPATPFALNRVPLVDRNRRKIAYVAHGIDTDRYSPQPQPGDPERRERSILYLGLLEPHKGVDTLIDAFDIVARRSPRARLIVAGRGSMLESLERRAARSGWKDRFEYAGFVTREDVPGWLRACSLLCSPSLGEPYGQGVVEAMACGRPVVVTDDGGVRYLARDTGNPVVPGRSPELLADALTQLVDDKARIESLGAANRALALERHAWPRVVDTLERTYRDVLAERAARR